MKLLPLDTPRLRIRRFVAGDSEALFAYRNDPEVARYQSFDGITMEAARELACAHAERDFVPGEWLQIALESRDDGVLIGDVAVQLSRDAQQAQLGYSLSRAYQRRGLGREAVEATVAALFERLGLHRIYASTDPNNVASVKLLERVGFRREAWHRESYWHKGGWADDLVYAMLAHEHAKLRAAAGDARGSTE